MKGKIISFKFFPSTSKDLFVLLDLIGAAEQRFPRFTHCEKGFFDMLKGIGKLLIIDDCHTLFSGSLSFTSLLSPSYTEKVMKSTTLHHISGIGSGKWHSYFSHDVYGHGVEDDHIPFLRRGRIFNTLATASLIITPSQLLDHSFNHRRWPKHLVLEICHSGQSS